MSTYKITPETKVPFPCWLYNRATLAWCWHFTEENLHVNHTHYSINPPDQPPLGEPAPEGSLPVTEPEKCEVCGGNEPCSHDFDKIGWPTPAAPSLQSVAEGAANEQAKFVESMCNKLGGVGLVACFKGILTRHFAPVYAALTGRDERLGRLEEAREDALQALGEHPESETDLAQRIREIRQEGRDLFHDITALRTRCEEMEKGLRDAVNASCSCGGEPAESAKACPACMVWHRIHAARKEGQQAHQKGQKPDTYNARKHEEAQP